MKNILFFLVFVVLCCCNNPSKPAHSKKPRQQFRTTAPSRLYFKNMRSFYYEQSTESDTRIDLYTLKKFSAAGVRPLLVPVIADNWLEDEAYIILNDDNRNPINDSFRLRFEYNQQVDTLILVKSDIFTQYQLAKTLYQRLKQGHKVSTYTSNKIWEPVFENQADKANFLKVMNDYYQLIETSEQ